MPSSGKRLMTTVVDVALPSGIGPSYERKRKKKPPNGWTVATARVVAVEREEKWRLRIEKDGREHPVCATVIRYAVNDAGTELIDDLDLVHWDVPQVGEQVTIAYDPEKAGRMVLLN